MKKLLSIIAVLILAFSLCSIGASALPKPDYPTVTISDDYNKLYYNGTEYIATDDPPSYYSDEEFEWAQLEHSDKQSETIAAVDVYIGKRFIEVQINFVSGGYYTRYYIDPNASELPFTYFESDTVYFTLDYGDYEFKENISKLKGNSKKVAPHEAIIYERYSVYDSKTQYTRGWLLVDAKNSSNMYFVDFSDLSEYDPESFSIMDYDTVTLYEIKDKKLLADMKDSYDSQYSYGYMDFNAGAVVSTVIFSLIFAGVPIVLIIGSIIMLCIKKSPKKSRFVFTIALSLCELAAFGLVLFNIIKNINV